MELRILTNYLQDLCHQGLSHLEVIIRVGGRTFELLVVQTNKKGKPVILIGADDAENAEPDEG